MSHNSYKALSHHSVLATHTCLVGRADIIIISCITLLRLLELVPQIGRVVCLNNRHLFSDYSSGG